MHAHVTIALCALFAAADAAAQRMGSANHGAPAVTQSIAFSGGATLTVKHIAITWAGGQMMTQLKTADDETRARFNEGAAQHPLGAVKVEGSVALGGRTVGAGKYTLYFTLAQDNGWSLVLASGAVKHEWPLPLVDGAWRSSRLTLELRAGEKDTEAELELSFGARHCTITCSAGAEQAKPAAGKPDKK